MTCIVGIAHQGIIYLGGDSAGVSDYDLTLRKDEKVFSNGEFVMGFTSSFRMGQILRYIFTPPTIDTDDTMAYMVRQFIPAIRTHFKNEGYMHIDSNREHGGHFLVGVRGRLFHIEDNFQVGESLQNFEAIGCGDKYALGYLYAQRNDDTEPTVRLRKALETATYFSVGVAPPFNFVHT